MESRFEEKNVLDVVEWLRNNGISDEIADIFEGKTFSSMIHLHVAMSFMLAVSDKSRE